MYYHATQVKGIKVLEPRISNHGKPYIYFSDKRENVLVYLSNAIEKFCKENNFKHNGIYPNVLIETYKGVKGYIYKVENVSNISELKDIPHAYVTKANTKIDSFEYIKDAYETIMLEVKKGNIILVEYKDFIKEKKDWLEKTIKKEYEESINNPEYRYFLENKFSFINKSM